MEELKIIMEALAKMGDGATTAFVIWCIKELLVYLVFPLSIFVIGRIGYKFFNRYIEEIKAGIKLN